MKLKIVSVLGALLFILNCATVEPPKVENERYVFPDNEFSIRVPDGWEYSETIPEIYPGQDADLTNAFNESLVAVFSAPDYQSYILVNVIKTEVDWAALKLRPDLVISYIKDDFEEAEKVIAESPHCSIISAAVYGDNIVNCITHCIAAKYSIECRDGMGPREGLNAHMHLIIYKSGYRSFYTAALSLFSRLSRYVDSVKDYESVLDSFAVY